jgi:hypothetical protein
VRLRQVGPNEADVPVQAEPVENVEESLGSAKRRTKSAAKSTDRTKSAAKSARRTTSAAKLRAQQGGRVKSESRPPSSRRGAPASRTARTRRRVS